MKIFSLLGWESTKLLLLSFLPGTSVNSAARHALNSIMNLSSFNNSPILSRFSILSKTVTWLQSSADVAINTPTKPLLSEEQLQR